MMNKVIVSTILGACLTGCLDSSGGDDEVSIQYQGYFIDTAVVNLDFQSTSHSGRTGSNGTFPYTPGESIQFSFLGADLGSIVTSESTHIVTPATLLGQGDLSASDMENFLRAETLTATAQSIINRLVLLQSFDEDQNLDNGINLIPAQFDSTLNDWVGVSDTHLANLNLEAGSNSFRSAAQTKLTEYRSGHELVSDAEAITHFLNSLESAEALNDYIGRWNMRGGDSGDLSAVYTFNEDGSVALIEYDNCPANLWGSTETVLKRYCTPVNIAQTFSVDGSQLVLTSSSFKDTCLPLSSNSHEVIASCFFYGYGDDSIRLQRAPLNFDQAPFAGTYQELEAGSSTITQWTINEDGTGSYTSQDENGSITWSQTNATQIAVTATPTQGSPVNVTFTFVGYIKGSWLLSTSGSTTQANTVFRSTQNTTSNTLLDVASFYGIYDANPSGTGECKSVRIKDINALQTNKPLLEFESSASNNYQCDYPINWYESAEEAGDDYVERTMLDLDTSNNQFKINNSVCHLLGIDDLELDALYVACEASANRFNIEIWQLL